MTGIKKLVVFVRSPNNFFQHLAVRFSLPKFQGGTNTVSNVPSLPCPKHRFHDIWLSSFPRMILMRPENFRPSSCMSKLSFPPYNRGWGAFIRYLPEPQFCPQNCAKNKNLTSTVTQGKPWRSAAPSTGGKVAVGTTNSKKPAGRSIQNQLRDFSFGLSVESWMHIARCPRPGHRSLCDKLKFSWKKTQKWSVREA